MRREDPLTTVARLFRVFYIDIVPRLRRCATHAQLIDEYAKALKEAKPLYRKLAMENHPDRGGDEEKLKRITAAWSDLQRLQRAIAPVQAAMRPQPVTWVSVSHGSTVTSTSTTYTIHFGGFGGFGSVAGSY